MEYIHVKNLEKFHPGYKDRRLQWAKIYFDMVQGDPDCELIESEIDWARLVKMILLELRARKPLPNFDRYWTKNGFDVKKRPMSLTLKVLHNFIEVVTELSKDCVIDKSREEEDKEKIVCNKPTVTDFIQSLKTNQAYSHINIDTELGKIDAWLLAHPGRQKTKRFIVNWLNKIEKPLPKEKAKPAQPTYKPPPKSEQFKFIPKVNKLLKDLADKKGVKNDH